MQSTCRALVQFTRNQQLNMHLSTSCTKMRHWQRNFPACTTADVRVHLLLAGVLVLGPVGLSVCTPQQARVVPCICSLSGVTLLCLTLSLSHVHTGNPRYSSTTYDTGWNKPDVTSRPYSCLHLPFSSCSQLRAHLSPTLNSHNLVYCLSCCHHPAHSCLGQPSDTISPFVDTTVDFSSPIVSYNFSFFPIKWLFVWPQTTDHHQQSFVFSSSQSHMPQPTTITHFPFWESGVISSFPSKPANSTVILEHQTHLYHNTITLRYSTNDCVLYWFKTSCNAIILGSFFLCSFSVFSVIPSQCPNLHHCSLHKETTLY